MKYASSSWHRHKHIILTSVLCIAMYTIQAQAQNAQTTDRERLGKAIEYFQTGKYHEAMLLFSYLNEHHRLSARTIAYLGVSCYYDGEYAEACKYLDQTADKISVYAPQERLVYYRCNADAHYRQEQYAEAIGMYERCCLVGDIASRQDSAYHIALCYIALKQWSQASEWLHTSLAYLEAMPTNKDTVAKTQSIREAMEMCRQ